jgi:hypothetical protein
MDKREVYSYLLGIFNKITSFYIKNIYKNY